MSSSRRGLRGLLVLVALNLGAAAPASRPMELAFDASVGLGKGWQDLGWAPRELAPGQPAKLDLADRGGWILSRKGLGGSFEALLVQYRAPARLGDFLEVRLDSARPGRFPRVVVGSELRRPVADGWTEAIVPLGLLDPGGVPFDQIVLRAHFEVGHERIVFNRIALVPGIAAPVSASVAVTPPPTAAPRPIRFVADCRARPRPISPLIYGTASGDPIAVEMGASAMRWGGNPTTRYNWQANAWNVGSDWYFRNAPIGTPGSAAYEEQIQRNHQAGMVTALTVPTIGWVAKDTTSYSFPVSVFGPQESVAPDSPDMGNGKSKSGAPLPPLPPTRTSVPAPPEFIGKWLETLRAKDRGRRAVKMVILDNEPMAWHQTHRDVHPQPLGYDEYLDRSIKYAKAVRKAYPEVQIAGPAEWGWSAYFYSAVDIAAGTTRSPDRRAHFNVPLLPWWLARMRAEEKRTGLKLLDVLDVHYYPQGNGIGHDRNGATDEATNALRIRSTRSLWDPTYLDESWINDRVGLIPRLHRWVDQNAPGLGISLGEYSFGASGHMSGGLAQAEALGRFGTQGLTSAFLWFLPAKESPGYWAFRAYRNFDGKGGRFLDLAVPVRAEDVDHGSLFLSRSESGDHLVALLLNLHPSEALAAEIDLSSCGGGFRERAFGYAGGSAGFQPGPASTIGAGTVRRTLPPYSMTVLDLTAAP